MAMISNPLMGGSAFAIRTMPGNRVDDNFVKEE
jgi:hypothetical protein